MALGSNGGGTGSSISDGAWIRAGAYNADDDGTSWADGMRGDGVGVRDVGAVYDGRTGSERHCHNCGDGRTARRVNEYGGVDGQWNDERHNTQQHWRDGIGVCDGAWIGAGTDYADVDGPSRADGMRGDGVGVGDVGAVYDGRPEGERHDHRCCDGRGSRCECV